MDNDSYVEIDLELFSKQELINIIQYAHEHNFTFNKAIASLIERSIQELNCDTSLSSIETESDF